MKKRIVLLLLLALCLGLFAGCGGQTEVSGEAGTVLFTDSVGRQVELPREITRVAPSGAVATMFLASVCPEYMVCINAAPDPEQAKYLDGRLSGLPAAGQLYGSKSTINLEALLDAKPQLIIDLGDAKKGMAEDLDALQEQTRIPVVFIEADLSHMAAAFRSLGQFLSGKAERCEELAAYVEETLALAEAGAAQVTEAERLSVMYTSGASGLNTNAEGSTQAQVLGLVGAENAIVVEDVSNKGGGNVINLEQLYLFDPDVILFTADSLYGEAAEDPSWNKLRAVEAGSFYEIPCLPYNWMSNPPSLNMLLGIRWLGNLLYPRYFDYDMAAEAQRAYKLLWNYDLTAEEAAELLQNSTGKAG